MKRIVRTTIMPDISNIIIGLGLCSGGLDSILSALTLRNQGIDVRWVCFETPFFSSSKAKHAADKLNIPLTVKNITPVYIEMLKNPPAGYGKHMNPCMDCHALMFKLAGKIMVKKGYDFLYSGEVVGQRPMSQKKQSLRYVEKHSGFDGHILRPLSAKLLPETIPEQKGLVDRSLLLDISGRSRKAQISLAKELGVTDYPSPAGGCLLTDYHYSTRLKDLFEHQDAYTENELHLLKYGRHFRLKNLAKVIIGRTEKDNEKIIKFYNPERDTLLKLEKQPGPTVLIPNNPGNDSIMLGASMCAGYGKVPDNTMAPILLETSEVKKTLQTLSIAPSAFKKMMI